MFGSILLSHIFCFSGHQLKPCLYALWVPGMHNIWKCTNNCSKLKPHSRDHLLYWLLREFSIYTVAWCSLHCQPMLLCLQIFKWTRDCVRVVWPHSKVSTVSQAHGDWYSSSQYWLLQVFKQGALCGKRYVSILVECLYFFYS